ncbi:MAG: FABP family protein [gamma proteobacterium symbiont of Bathyaustriella thionipta]|nr:FABP family protein [gamma proteobacterium symbiont of Bathyaustriella thionipta]
MSDEIIKNLGPLAPLAGIWEGAEGVDFSRIHSKETETRFRERITFSPLGPVNNGPQALYGLRYATTCWRLDEDEGFHEETGYWLWDKMNQQVIRSFVIPRGVTINAGGDAGEDSRSFHLQAAVGSETYGICSNIYLHESYKTMAYTLDVTVHDDGTFSYSEDTHLYIPINDAIFHHTDKNTLKKVAS